MNTEIKDGEIALESGDHPEPVGANATGTHSYSKLKKKLFKVKNLHELQDTEANNDDSQLKVSQGFSLVQFQLF